MDNMDIDQVAYVPDTPDRSSQPNTNAGVRICEESDLGLPGSLKDRDFSDEELRNQQSPTPELIIDNKGTRLFYRPSKNLSVSDNPECCSNVIRNSSSSNNVTSCTRTTADRITNHHNHLSFHSGLPEKGKAPSSSELFACSEGAAAVDLAENQRTFQKGAAAVDLAENQRTFQKGASGNCQVEPKKESIPANGFSWHHIANTTKRKEKVDNRGRVGSSADHLKGFHLSVGDQFKGGKTVSGSLPAASFPRVMGQKRLVRNGCISPHNIAKAKQLAEKHDNVSSSVLQNNVETATTSFSSDLTNLRDMVAEESNVDRVKEKGLINYSYSSKDPDIKILNFSSRSSDGSSGSGDVIKHSEELGGWRTTHTDRKKSNLSLSDVGQHPSRGKDGVAFGNQQHENRVVRRVRGNEISVSNDLSEDQDLSSKEVLRPVKCGKFCLRQCGEHQLPANTKQGSASHNGGECSTSANSKFVFLRSPREQSNLRSTRTQNHLRLGTMTPVVQIDDFPEIQQRSSLSAVSSMNAPDVRARQLEADELLARELQEQLYNEMPGVEISEIDAQLALALQQQYSQHTFSGRGSSTSDSRRRAPSRSSLSSSAQVRVPTNRMARLRNRFPGQPRTLSSRIRNSLFTPSMDLDERIHILEALEAFTDMGMAGNLLQVNRDFNENDYEMLLSLDEDNHRVGISVDQINGLAQSIIQRENFEEDCAICLETPTIGDTIRHLPCLHKFHKDCIDTWLRRKALCPVCKSSIT